MKLPVTLLFALLLSAAFFAAPAARAQTNLTPIKWTARYNQEETNDLGLWPQTLTTIRYRKWAFEFDACPRLQYRVNRFNDLQLRCFAAYRAKPWLSVWLGTYPWSPVFEPQYINEQRTLQQFGLEKAYKRVGLSLRSRLEQRFIEHLDTTAWRIREMPRIDYFIDKKKSLYVYVADEMFINLNTIDDVINGGFAQNRLWSGVGYKVLPHTRLEVSYLNQFLRRDFLVDDPPDRFNHNVVINVISNF